MSYSVVPYAGFGRLQRHPWAGLGVSVSAGGSVSVSTSGGAPKTTFDTNTLPGAQQASAINPATVPVVGLKAIPMVVEPGLSYDLRNSAAYASVWNAAASDLNTPWARLLQDPLGAVNSRIPWSQAYVGVQGRDYVSAVLDTYFTPGSFGEAVPTWGTADVAVDVHEAVQFALCVSALFKVMVGMELKLPQNPLLAFVAALNAIRMQNERISENAVNSVWQNGFVFLRKLKCSIRNIPAAIDAKGNLVRVFAPMDVGFSDVTRFRLGTGPGAGFEGTLFYEPANGYWRSSSFIPNWYGSDADKQVAWTSLWVRPNTVAAYLYERVAAVGSLATIADDALTDLNAAKAAGLSVVAVPASQQSPAPIPHAVAMPVKQTTSKVVTVAHGTPAALTAPAGGISTGVKVAAGGAVVAAIAAALLL